MSQQTEDADAGIGKGKNSPLQFYKSLAGASIVRVEYYAKMHHRQSRGEVKNKKERKYGNSEIWLK